MDNNIKYELYSQGLSDVEMGKKLNVSKSSIRRWRNKNNLVPNFYPVNKINLNLKNSTTLIPISNNEYKSDNLTINDEFFNREPSEILFDILKTINKKDNEKQILNGYKNQKHGYMICLLEHIDFGFYREELMEIQKMIVENNDLKQISKKLNKSPFAIILYMIDVASKKRSVKENK